MAIDEQLAGRLSGVSLPGGVPVRAIERAFRQRPEAFALLSFADRNLSAINQVAGDVWQRVVLAADTYPGQTSAVATIGQPNDLLTRADTPDDLVTALLESMHGHQAFPRTLHPASAALLEVASGVPFVQPLHPAAERFYAERDLLPRFEGS